MANQCPICNGEIAEGVRTCPACGYHVLDSTQSFKPVKVEDGEVVTESFVSAGQRYELKVVRGPQTGVDIALHEGTMVVGRDPRCDVFLNDMTVSRSHATIEVSQEGCVLRDNSSFNGVWVNDRAVEVCLLKSGDLIQIGAFCLMYKARL